MCSIQGFAVEPLLKDLPIKDTIEITSLQRTLCKSPKIDFPKVLIHDSPLKRGQPLYSGQISWSRCVLYREVPLYKQNYCILGVYGICSVAFDYKHQLN